MTEAVVRMRKIRISLNPSDLDELAKQLRQYAKQLPEMADEMTARLSEEAATVARQHFSNDVTVDATANGVTATGESVVFEEFGAGARISDPFPDGADVDFEIRRGAYSDLHNGEYSQTGYQYWHHDGERYEYVTPRNGLFYGMQAAREKIKEIAEEVFG